MRRRTRAEEKLREAEAKYRTLVEQLPLVTYIDALTPTATAIYASPQVESLLGYSMQEWLEDPEFFAKILHPHDRERVLAQVDHCNTTTEPFRSEYRLIARDGRTVWVQDESLVVCDEDGRPLFTQGYLLDITDRKESEERLAAEHGVARVLAESATFGEAAPRILEVVAEALGWESGALWLLDRTTDVLRRSTTYRSPGDEAVGLETLASECSVTEGEGLPGRVWARREAVWVASHGSGALGAYALPILLGAELLGVMEFAGRALRRPDATLARTLAVIGSQVAQFIERTRSEEALRASDARKRAILDSARDCVITVDHEARIVDFNPAAEQTFGRTLEEVRGGPLFELLIPPRLRHVHERAFEQYLSTGDESMLGGRIEAQAMRADGTEFPIEITVVRVDLPGPPVLTAYIRDITDRKRVEDERRSAEEKIWHQALHDGLTGLPNRRLFHDRVGEAIERADRGNRGLAVLVMDLDRFKEINDTLGHASGDALLHELGERLRSRVRGCDTVARLGGDEFGFLLDDVTASEAVELVERIQRALAEPFTLQHLPLQVESSIGIALHPEHGATVDVLLRRADVAMYVAKRSSSGYAFYDAASDDHTLSRLTMGSELRHALEQRELALHFQPLVSLGTGTVVGAEALLRWPHATRGLVPPAEFLPIAEQTALMGPVTSYVIDEALRQCLAWQRLGHDLTVAVNISMRNLLDGAFPAQIEALLEKWCVPGRCLMLEITEHSFADRFRLKAVLEQLSRLGLRVAIDDFGTGYSSLAYLRRLPLHTIKIDQSFVRAVTTDRDDAVIVRSTIELARNLGLEVVAEGVETRETYLALSELGCDLAQGYYVSPPLPVDEFTAWLRGEGAAWAHASDHVA